MAKQTPGPWHVEDEFVFNETGARVADTGDIDFIEDQGMTSAEADANARLIAAAPELLEALQAILDKGTWGRWDLLKADGVLDMAQAAIAKATGGAR